MHSGPFGCLTKLDAKRAEVVQKFMPWNRVGIFGNKRTRSTLLTLTSCFGVFRTIWVHLVQFVALLHSVENGPNLCKSSWHEVTSEFFTTNTHDQPHWTLNSCFGVFCTIWVHLVPFGYLTKLGAKRAEVVQKFVPWSRVRISDYKPLDPPHWTLTSCFVTFRTIWMHLGQFVALQHSVQNGPNLCKSSCHEVASEFFAMNAPDPPHWTLNSCFGVFRTIWMHLGQFVALQHSVQNGPNWCKSSCHDVASEFLTTN